jgi:CRP-like cAMP-binding protein
MVRGAAIAEAAEHTTETFPLIDKLTSYLSVSPAEVEFLRDLHGRKRRFERNRDIIAQGRPYRSVLILCRGFVCRYKILPAGKRQVLNLGLPGDRIGLPACCFRECH